MAALDTNSWFIHTMGASGSPFSPHYDDWLALWAAGEYLPMRTAGYQPAATYLLSPDPSPAPSAATTTAAAVRTKLIFCFTRTFRSPEKPRLTDSCSPTPRARRRLRPPTAPPRPPLPPERSGKSRPGAFFVLFLPKSLFFAREFLSDAATPFCRGQGR